MNDFWQLSTEPYLRTEVFKILTETQNLEEKHLKFLVEQITLIKNSTDPNLQLSELELRLLSENVSFRRSETQKPKVVELFWSILKASDKYKRELVNDSIKYFTSFYKTDIGAYECLQLIKLFVKELNEENGRIPTATYTQFFCKLFEKIQIIQKIRQPDKEADPLEVKEAVFLGQEYKLKQKIENNPRNNNQAVENLAFKTKSHKDYVDRLTL